MTLAPRVTALQPVASAIAAYDDSSPFDLDPLDLSPDDITVWANNLPLGTATHLLRALLTRWIAEHNTGGNTSDLNRVLHDLLAEYNFTPDTALFSADVPPNANSESWAFTPGDVPGSRIAVQVGSLREYESTKIRKPREPKKGKGKSRAKAVAPTTYSYIEYSFCWQERDEHGKWRSFSCYVGGCPVGRKPRGAAAQKIATIERQCANHRPYGETLTLIGKENRINSLKQGNRSY